MKELHRLQVQIPKEMYNELRSRAFKAKKSIAQIVREIIVDWMRSGFLGLKPDDSTYKLPKGKKTSEKTSKPKPVKKKVEVKKPGLCKHGSRKGLCKYGC